MKKNTNLFIFLLIAFFSASSMVFGIQAETENKCFACHKKIMPGLFIQWADSKHAKNDVACIDCHGAEENDLDAFLHNKVYVATLVTPKDCGNCHDAESEEVSNSYHATAGEILDSNDAYLALSLIHI